MIQKLRRKFVAIIMGMVFVVMAAVFLVSTMYFSNSIYQETYRNLEIVGNLPPGGKPDNFQPGGKENMNALKIRTYFILEVNVNQEVSLLNSEGVTLSEEEIQHIGTETLAQKKDQGTLPEYDLLYLKKHVRDGLVLIFTPLSNEKAQVRQQALLNGGIMLGSLVVFFFLSIFLSKWAVRPVQSAWDQQKRFVADASHELRTPITVILANLKILQSHPKEPIEEQMVWIENTQAETLQMKDLVENLLFLARSEDSGQDLVFSKVDFTALVETNVLLFDSLAYEQGTTLEMSVEKNLFVEGNEVLLKRLVGILVENALKYGTEKNTVFIKAREKSGMVELSVENQGKTIPPEDLPHLLERFYRSDVSRSSDGYGLGLSIAQNIVEQHRGKISVTSENGTTIFKVRIPERRS